MYPQTVRYAGSVIHSPFRIFAPYQDRLNVAFFEKADDIHSDNQLAETLGTDRIVSLRQVHGNRIVIVGAPMLRTEEADGMWTKEKDLTLTIRVADCQSFIAYAPDAHIVGLLHSGWRGLVKGSIPAFIKTLTESFDVDPSKVLIGAGPSLCTKCAEFTDPKTELAGIDEKFFHGRNADLQAIADQQFIDAGVQKKNIERMTGCTKCDHETLWSYRGGDRDAVRNGYENVLTCSLL
jgi:YfiH family protein